MIRRFTVIREHLSVPRTRGRCSECGKIRMRTRIDLLADDEQSLVIEHLCRECLTRTPPWGSFIHT